MKVKNRYKMSLQHFLMLVVSDLKMLVTIGRQQPSLTLTITTCQHQRQHLFIYLFTKYRKRDRARAGLPEESNVM